MKTVFFQNESAIYLMCDDLNNGKLYAKSELIEVSAKEKVWNFWWHNHGVIEGVKITGLEVKRIFSQLADKEKVIAIGERKYLLSEGDDYCVSHMSVIEDDKLSLDDYLSVLDKYDIRKSEGDIIVSEGGVLIGKAEKLSHPDGRYNVYSGYNGTCDGWVVISENINKRGMRSLLLALTYVYESGKVSGGRENDDSTNAVANDHVLYHNNKLIGRSILDENRRYTIELMNPYHEGIWNTYAKNQSSGDVERAFSICHNVINLTKGDNSEC